MAFDYKKEYKAFYVPNTNPIIVDIPRINYIAVRGKGNPNNENSEYKQSISLLYAIAYTIKMSKFGSRLIEGYFDYVIPPLEGLWWQEGQIDIDYQQKETFCFISMIRLPDFVTKEDFEWTIQEATRKKKMNFLTVEFFCYEEGRCVQCMHIGSYDNEPLTIRNLHQYIKKEGYEVDFESRYHHEIYLSDPRKCNIDKCKTVIRIPIRIKKFES